MACSMYTRSQYRHSVFGDPKELPRNVIPLCEDVFRVYRQRFFQDKSLSVLHIARSVAEELINIYTTASIPTVEYESVVKKVQRLIQKGNDLTKYSESRRKSVRYQEIVKSFSKVFDICSCRCIDLSILERRGCQCPLNKKIPALEWDFWLDQKTERRMIIGKVDEQVTEMIVRSQERKEREKRFEEESKVQAIMAAGAYLHDGTDDECKDDEEIYHSSSFDEQYDSEEDSSRAPQNRHQYPELCKSIDRANISNRDACLIINSALKDLGLLNPTNALDPSKLRRQRTLCRSASCTEIQESNRGITCLGFDGRKDETLLKDGPFRRKFKEEHYVLVSFPDGHYIDHVVPISGKSEDVSRELISVITGSESLTTLQAIVCDGTPVNTGKRNGIIQKIEQHLERPVQWLICMMHANELTLRRLLETVDGRMTGPKSYEGELTKMMNFEPQDKPIISFNPVPGNVVEVKDAVMQDFSTDQSYLLKICLLVQQGLRVGNKDVSFLQAAQPGARSHARWLTKANALLRLYVSQEHPSGDLLRLVRFIVVFYAPCWFNIKCHSNAQDGARNFFFMISRYQELDKADQDIIAPVLINNNYFCHPENILLTAVGDEDEKTRKFACDKVIEARQQFTTGTRQVRCFDKTQVSLNFSATSYIDMIDWTNIVVTPPPLLNNIDSDVIANHHQRIIIPSYPCHSQAVERNIKDVTAACRKVYGHDSRHGVIVQMKKSRSDLPNVETKSDFL